jgi:hypothetical protein
MFAPESGRVSAPDAGCSFVPASGVDAPAPGVFAPESDGVEE